MTWIFLILSAAMAGTPANTVVQSEDGLVEVSGQTSYALHTHGGAAARLGVAQFEVKHRHSEPLSMTVSQVAFLRGHSCKEAPSQTVSQPAISGLVVGEDQQSRETALIPSGEPVRLQVEFEPVEAYYTHCDRFVFVVSFQVRSETLVAQAETRVTRMEPARGDLGP